MHWYTRCGFIGTLSKLVLRNIVRLRSRQSAAQARRSGRQPSALRALATSTNSSSAARASETMP